jgi:short-subunit dehydrogenase
MKLVIITGATGKLGAEYLKNFRFKKGYKCLVLVRNKSITLENNVDYSFVDLLDQEEVKESLSNLDVKPYKEIIFIHPIGMFKFEREGIPLLDKNKDGIDDDIFASNVTTFLNVFKIVKDKIKKEANCKIKLTIFAFGSITHNYNIPFWQSYTKSKQYLKKIIKQNLEEKSFKIRCIFVNVSTVDTGNERNLRPCADRSYWLTPQEIVKISLKYLRGNNKWMEISLYKNNPNFDPTWYTNHENVLKRWQEQMGIKN